ncbi:MAG: methylated-DNA--[protein]-cysteine S-methyltransferase [Fimbriimonadaceae bacterium]
MQTLIKEPIEFLEQLKSELSEYFDGQREEFSVPLRLKGTDFQKQVWAALQEIPFGQTLSYSGLAEKLAIKNGQRAVGKANGDNPVSILVPCHRVVRADGDLCGYAGGIWRKQFLLALESGQTPLF